MAAIVQPMMETGDAPWPLYMAGAFFAVLLWMMKIPPLPFALGTFLVWMAKRGAKDAA